MGLITDLIGARGAYMDLGNAYTQPLGYVIIWVQVDGVQGYNKDQIALVVLDLSNFVERIPVILGALTISHIVNVMKGREIDALEMPWAYARVAHLLSVCTAAATVMSNKTTEDSSLKGYDGVVITQNMEIIDAFSSQVIPVKAEKGYMGKGINVMTQALQTEDSSLPQGPTIQKLGKDSKNAVMVVRISTAYPQTHWKKALLAREVAGITVPEPPLETRVWGEGWWASEPSYT